MSVALAQAVFAWVQWRDRMASVRTMVRRFFAGAAWKWVVLFGLFALGLSFQLSPPAMLAGLIVALMAGTGALIRYG
jgi:F0F1-type ATP synthase assembly protein I